MKVANILGCTVWAAFLMTFTFWVPVFGPMFSLLTPLPFLYYNSKLGLKQGIKVSAVAISLIGFISVQAGYSELMPLSLEFCVLGIVLSVLLQKKISFGQTVFIATVFMLFLLTFFLFYSGLQKNLGINEMVKSYIDEHFQLSLNVYKEMGMPPDKTGEMEAVLKRILDIISMIYPSLFIIGTGFAVWLNMVIAGPLFRYANLAYPDFIPLDRWKAPDKMVWGVIAAGFSCLIFSGIIKILAANALIVMAVIYFFQGLSIALSFFNKYNVPHWIRAGLYFLIIVQQIFFVLLVFVGLFDQWIDFRKNHRGMDI